VNDFMPASPANVTQKRQSSYNAGVSEDTRRLLAIFLTVVGLVGAVLALWQRREQLRPQLEQATVVFWVEGEGPARQELPPVPAGAKVWAGALLQFRQGKGPVRTLCPFPEVQLSGQLLRPEPPSAWPASYGVLKAQWFTVEPALFGGEGVAAESAEKLAYGEFAAPELGSELRAPLPPEPHNDDFLADPLPGNRLAGGCYRLKVKVSAYRDPRDVLPWASIGSPGAAQVESVPTLCQLAPVPQGVHPKVVMAFRCSVFTFAAGVWPEGGQGWPLPLSPRELVASGLVMTPQAVAALAAVGDPLAEPWEPPVPVTLSAGVVEVKGRALRWGADLRPGDALTWAGRWAVAWEDDGNDLLDGADRVLFAWMQPPRLVTLGEVARVTGDLSLRRVVRGQR
jgi:hypothetical protein